MTSEQKPVQRRGRGGRGGRRGRGRGGNEKGASNGKQNGNNNEKEPDRTSATPDFAIENSKTAREGSKEGQGCENKTTSMGRGSRQNGGGRRPQNRKDGSKCSPQQQDSRKVTAQPASKRNENAIEGGSGDGKGSQAQNHTKQGRRRGRGRQYQNRNSNDTPNQQQKTDKQIRATAPTGRPEKTEEASQPCTENRGSRECEDGVNTTRQPKDSRQANATDPNSVEEINSESIPCTVDDELEERRQAEVEFVASAYSPEEAWCSETTTYPIQVYRRLSLQDPNISDHFVSVILTLSMTEGYPATEPLNISFALEKGKTDLWNCASDAAPILVEACRQVALEVVGDEAIFTVLSHADEWVQDHWPTFCEPLQQETNQESSRSGEPKPNGGTLLGRRLIYSHHIISKTKRANIKDLTSRYQLTGYVKIGWPGIIIIEGLEEHCQYFYDDIKVWAWKYLVVRGEMHEKAAMGESIDSLRRFSCFQFVSEMSVVADHCREVGLEPLFKTSMKVYETNDIGSSMPCNATQGLIQSYAMDK